MPVPSMLPSEQLSFLWWVRLPLRVRYLSRSLAVALIDGIYLAARPWVGALAPPAALAVGLVIGWLRPDYSDVFTESLVILALAAVLGVLSGQLGGMFLLGFALGDFFLANTIWEWRGSTLMHLAHVRVPMLIEYWLLALLVLLVPITTKSLMVQLRFVLGLPRQARFVVALVGHALLTGALVYFWTQSAPLLIRPAFTWSYEVLPVAAIAPLQQQGWIVVAAAIAASVVRMVLQVQTVPGAPLGVAVDRLARPLAEAMPVASLGQRIPPWGRVIGTSAWATLLLSGMMEGWIDALILGGLIVLVQAARARLLPVPLGAWPAWIEQVPLLGRLAIGFSVVFLLSRLMLAQQLSNSSFRPFVLLTAVSLIITFLLAPGRAIPQVEEGGPVQ